MSGKINVLGIVREHLKTLRHHGRDESSVVDITVFVLCPLILSALVVVARASFPDALAGAMITASAILLGLLLNLLVLLFDQRNRAEDALRTLSQLNEKGQKPPDPDGREGKLTLRIKLLKETVANISFTVLLCLTSLATLLLRMMAAGSSKLSGLVDCAAYGVNVFVWISVFLIVLMIVKRVFVIFSETS